MKQHDRRWRRSSTERAAGPADRYRSQWQLTRYVAIVLVTDASVLVTALADDGPDGDMARSRLRAAELAAPDLVDLEVTSVLRRLAESEQLPTRRAELALADLAALPLRRVPHLPLLARCWELRRNVSVYDAAYIAVAEALGVTVVTADARLARAPGIRCPVEVWSRREG